MSHRTEAGPAQDVAEMIRAVLDRQALIVAKLDAIQRQLDARRTTEADEARFLAAVAAYCLRDGDSPTFTAREIFEAKDDAIANQLWWVGETPAAVAALFKRCEGCRIGNVRLTRIGKRAAGIAWQWVPVE